MQVPSTNVEDIDYRNDRLYIRYRGGQTYAYMGLPLDTIRDLLIIMGRRIAGDETASVGKFVNQRIKPEATDVVRLELGPATTPSAMPAEATL